MKEDKKKTKIPKAQIEKWYEIASNGHNVLLEYNRTDLGRFLKKMYRRFIKEC